MQVTETSHEGLSRELQIVIPAADLEERLMQNLDYTQVADIIPGGPAYKSKELYKGLYTFGHFISAPVSHAILQIYHFFTPFFFKNKLKSIQIGTPDGSHIIKESLIEHIEIFIELIKVHAIF